MATTIETKQATGYNCARISYWKYRGAACAW